MPTPSAIVRHMLENDAFSKWLGISILECAHGKVTLNMTVREEMTNGFGIGHGGICYSLSDTALAFAANTRGQMAVSIDTSIRHLEAVKTGDQLTATATELKLGNKTAHYEVKVHNQSNEVVSHFLGTVYRRSRVWEIE